MRIELFIFLIAEIISEAIPISWNLPNATSGSSSPAGCSGNDNECQSAGGGQGRQKQSPLTFAACMRTTITVENKDFLVLLDTGSSDTVLPYMALNDYSGILYVSTYTSGTTLSASYGDGSSWRGYKTIFNVSLKGTTISGPAPIVVMTSQNVPTQSVAQFVSGSPNQGLMGLGYPSLARGGDTVVNAWYKDNALSRYQIAIQGCSPSNIANSWIDIGNDTSYSGCGESAIIFMPDRSYYTINVVDIAFSGVSQGTPSGWQSSQYSLLDSCTTLIYLPTSVYSSFTTAIYNSGGFSTRLQNDANLLNYITGVMSIPYRYTSNDFIWSKLPTFSITVASYVTSNSTVTLTIGPKQYIMENFFWFTDGGSIDYFLLGYPYFAAYFMVADLSNGLMTMQSGCDCASSTDGYPKVSTGTGTFSVTPKSITVSSSPSSPTSPTSGMGATATISVSPTIAGSNNNQRNSASKHSMTALLICLVSILVS